MASVPEKIRALSKEGVLAITWPTTPEFLLPFKLIRCECPCATCVHEFTGERLLKPEDVPDDVAPLAMNFVGNYALKIQWSDGHATGIYSWDLLERISAAPEVRLNPGATA
ncbi:DUF971 domain-containing protein [Planctomicrobium sp. SH664]|uniref:DUF971 domain-containing protein n=1 Tax=Planctomicrobium sp. SH664 TaxID=3448125 RepID=UPI003F5C8A87